MQIALKAQQSSEALAGEAVLALPEIEAEIAPADLYDGVPFAADPDLPETGGVP